MSDLAIRKARVSRIHDAGPDLRQLGFDSLDGPLIYRAGQWLSFKVGDGEPGSKGIWRVYSICTAPAEARSPLAPESFGVLAALDSGGPGASCFAGLVEGDGIAYHGPYGSFTLADDADSPIWLLADGVGIGPVRGLARALLARHNEAAITLIQEAVVPHALAFRSEFEAAAEAVGRFSYVPTVPGADSDWHGETRDLGQLVPALAAAAEVAGARWYLCGSGRRTDRLSGWLASAGVPAERVRVERFFD